jgi:hypothetical protein
MNDPDKTYIIKRIADTRSDSRITCTVHSDVSIYELGERNRASPCGFECGYSGGGPLGLAFEIPADLLWGISGESADTKRYVETRNAMIEFCKAFITPMHLRIGQSASIRSEDIRNFLSTLK